MEFLISELHSKRPRTSSNYFKVRCGHSEIKKSIAVEKDAYCAKVARLQELLSCYRHASSHLAKRHSYGEVRLGTGCAAAAKKTKTDGNHLSRGFFQWKRDCVARHIALVRTSVNQRSPTTVVIFCTMKSYLHSTTYGQSVSEDSSLAAGRAIPPCASSASFNLCYSRRRFLGCAIL